MRRELKIVFKFLLFYFTFLSFLSCKTTIDTRTTRRGPNTDNLSLGNGPGVMDPGYATSSSFLKATAQSLATTQHGEGQGKNADIWYSGNIQSLLGRSSIAPVPEGTVAIKKFLTGDNQTMITGMVKSGGSWQYFMGPENPFPTSPIPAADAQMCIGCHQSSGSQTDLLPYLPKAFVSSTTLGPGPGHLDPNFKSNPQFIKGTSIPLATTQHGEGQGRNAEIWYSANIRTLFGQSSVPSVPDGTVAIKQFLDGKNQSVITGMVKTSGTWQYYMGPANQFPTSPMPSADAQMCVGCHQSTGSQTDLLPYLRIATGN